MKVATEGRSLVTGSEQLVSDRMTALKQQLEEAQATLASHAAKRECRQELANERLRRWREQNPERVREQRRRHMRVYRARRREQGS